MSKRIKHLLIAGAALSIAAAVGLTLAFMFKKAEKTNLFIPAEVACAVREKLDNKEVTGIAVGSEKSDIRVENTGNVKEFIRLRLVSYYVDADENIVGTVSSQYPALILKNDWIAGANRTYYYPYPVEPGSLTGILCEPFTLGQTQLENGTVVYQVMEVIAEAVQAEPSDAAQEVWGVTVENGVVTAAQ